VARCGAKNGYQKDMSSKEIGLHAHNLYCIINSIVNIIFWGVGMEGPIWLLYVSDTFDFDKI
jgi:hypothetical protein